MSSSLQTELSQRISEGCCSHGAQRPDRSLLFWRALATVWLSLRENASRVCSGCNQTNLFRDVTVFVDVVQVKRPVEFLLDCSSQEDREAHDKILRQKQAGAHHRLLLAFATAPSIKHLISKVISRLIICVIPRGVDVFSCLLSCFGLLAAGSC